MTSKNLLSRSEGEIRRFSEQLEKAELLINRNYPHVSNKGKGINILAWNNYIRSSKTEFATVDEYMTFLTNNQYTLILFDGSLIRIVYYFKRQHIIRHQLGYYPPPVPIQQDELSLYLSHGLTVSDLINDKVNSNKFSVYLRLRSPIRFDFDSDNDSEVHPASHLHLSQSDCRIAVYAPVSIGLFLCFIFKHFYQEIWEKHEFFKQWPRVVFPEAMLPANRKHLHVACVK